MFTFFIMSAVIRRKIGSMTTGSPPDEFVQLTRISRILVKLLLAKPEREKLRARGVHDQSELGVDSQVHGNLFSWRFLRILGTVSISTLHLRMLK